MQMFALARPKDKQQHGPRESHFLPASHLLVATHRRLVLLRNRLAWRPIWAAASRSRTQWWLAAACRPLGARLYHANNGRDQ